MPEKSYFELMVTVFQETPKTLQSVALGCPRKTWEVSHYCSRHGALQTQEPGAFEQYVFFFLICKEMPWEHVVMYGD